MTGKTKHQLEILVADTLRQRQESCRHLANIYVVALPTTPGAWDVRHGDRAKWIGEDDIPAEAWSTINELRAKYFLIPG